MTQEKGTQNITSIRNALVLLHDLMSITALSSSYYIVDNIIRFDFAFDLSIVSIRIHSGGLTSVIFIADRSKAILLLWFHLFFVLESNVRTLELIYVFIFYFSLGN